MAPLRGVLCLRKAAGQCDPADKMVALRGRNPSVLGRRSRVHGRVLIPGNGCDCRVL